MVEHQGQQGPEEEEGVGEVAAATTGDEPVQQVVPDEEISDTEHVRL